MMKLGFVLILSLLIHGGKRVAGEPSADDIPDLTMSEQEGKTVLTEEELKDLNQLRKDALTSLEDLRKNMESDEGKEAVNKVMEGAVKSMKKDSYELKDKEDRDTHIWAVQEAIDADMKQLKPNEIQNEADKKKLEDFINKTRREFTYRLEPFEEYLAED